MDTKNETRHANHQMTPGNTRDTGRDIRLKLKWIQRARHDMRITTEMRRRKTQETSSDMRLKLKMDTKRETRHANH